MRLAVALNQIDLRIGATGEAEVADGLGIDWEEAGGGAVFGGHVGDGGAIGEREIREAASEVLDKAANHAVLAEHFRNGEDEVGGGRTIREGSGEAHPDDFRLKLVERLAEHDGLGLDAADTPSEHPDAVDHGCVAVGADDGVRKDDRCATFLLAGDHRGEKLEVDLVNDPGAGGNDAEVFEGALGPTEQGVPLAVSLVFQIHVLGESDGGTETVDLHRVVDHEIDGHQRIDLLDVPAHAGDSGTHRSEIDDTGDAGEVLQDHAGRHEGEFEFVIGIGDPGGRPLGECFNVAGVHELAAGMSQLVLQEDANGER